MSINQGSISVSQAPGGSSGGLPGVTVPAITFTVGDGQVGTPLAGTNSIELPTLQGQSLFNKQLIVVRAGIELPYGSAVRVNVIRRYNNAGNGGFVFEPASGITFQNGDQYDIYIIGVNNTIQT